MLDEIKAKLDELAKDTETPMNAVCYGLLPVGAVEDWNYLVFNRSNIQRSGTNKGDFNEYYAVNIVHENYIPDGYVYKLIGKMSEIKGLKLAPDNITFSYTSKSNTDIVVEVATVTFTKARKRGEAVG